MSGRPSAAPDWATNPDFAPGGNPWSNQPNKVQPSAGQIAEGFDPQTFIPAEWVNYILNNHGAWIDYLDSAGDFGFFGDGSDGSYVLDGTQPAVAGLFSKAGNQYTLLRDAFFEDITVTGGASVILFNGGYRIFGLGTCKTSGGSTIRSQGANGANAGGAAGTGAAANTLGGGGDGATGTAVGGNNAADVTNSYGGDGGDGGLSGGAGGGTGGAVTPPPTPASPKAYSAASVGWVLSALTGFVAIKGGAGGGGGAGDSIHFGGSGGGGGGTLVISARNIINDNATDFLAIGGTGGNGQVAGGAATGGGGGGGGGNLIVFYTTKALSGGGTPIYTAAANCGGGVAGTHFGAGAVDGQPGAVGTVFDIGNPGTLVVSPAGPHVESGFVTMAPGTFNVTINFSQNFPGTTGALGYDVEVSIYRTDGINSAIGWFLSSKAVDHAVIQLADDFAGELRWRAFK